MPEPAIVATDLGKRYQIAVTGGRAREGAATPSTPLSRAFGRVKARGFTGLWRRIGRREDFWALRHVSFEAERGRVMGIIGCNGSGKSTLLKILARITYPTEGVATVRGRVGSLLEIGTGFQQELTGRENVFLSGTILGMRRAEVEKRFEQIVEFAGVGRFIDTPVKHFSSGMYLRLAFAVASHLRAEVLLIDEVLAVGDAAFQKKCMDKMSEIAREGRTMFFVSHNLSAVSRLCNRCLVLNQGGVVALGPVDGAIHAYQELLKSGSEEQTEDAGAGIAIFDLHVVKEEQFIKSSEPIELVFDAVVRHRYWLVSFFVGISTPDGNHLVIENLGSEQHPELLEIGRHRVRLRLPPLWLRPQGYSAWVKVIAHPKAGKTKRFYSEWVDLVVFNDRNRDTSTDRLLAPAAAWDVSRIARGEPAPDAALEDACTAHAEA